MVWVIYKIVNDLPMFVEIVPDEVAVQARIAELVSDPSELPGQYVAHAGFSSER